MNIIYQGSPFPIEEGKNGFDVAKIVDPAKKNKALCYKQERTGQGRGNHLPDG